MRPVQSAGIIVGTALALLGLLWFLQGAGLVRMCPVLCFADCECIEGGSPSWAVAGAIAFALGAVVAGVTVRRRRA